MSSIAPSSSLAVVSLVVVVSAAEEAETERKTKTLVLPLSSLRKETLAIERTYARNLIEFIILNWKCVLRSSFLSCVVVASSSRINLKWLLRVLKPCLRGIQREREKGRFCSHTEERMPLFGEFKNISQTASLGETHFSPIACLHVCLYFFITFHVERQEAQREREE